MSNLYILGNGFDLQHQLPTAYNPHLKKLAIRGERFPDEWNCYSDVGDLWSDVEEHLAYPDIDMLVQHLEQYAPDLLSDRESDRDGIIHEAQQLLQFPLEEFARIADEAITSATKLDKFQNFFKPDDYFLTFNYTHTLESLYEIDPSQILHLHGEIGVSPLVFGYAPGELRSSPILHQWDDEEGYDHYRSTAHGELERRLTTFEKDYQLERLADFFTRVPKYFDQIRIYGLSFGPVDKPYFDQLARMFDNSLWTVYAHNEEALKDACFRLDSYGVNIQYDRLVK